MTLAAHGWEIELLAAIGGAIGALRHRGRDILRPAAPRTGDPLETACFPLVPYANRIADARFDFGGQCIGLPLNFGDHPHSLHGVGWQSEWALDVVDAATAVLHHTHDGDERWPWPYRCEQRIALAPGRATIGLTVTNLAEETAPVGLGLHPYFPRDAATRLTVRSDRLWLADPTMLPTEPVSADRFGDWSEAAGVDGDELIDNAYEGWDGAALIEQAWGRVRIEARGASAFHLYRPPGVDFFCFEPVSHLPDAINRGGMPMVARGETVALEMTLTVER